jgi:hypothetical protein
MRLRVAPLSASSRPSRVASPGCPFHAPFLLSRRPNPQVAPWFRSFGCAGDGRSSCPELRMLSAVPVSAGFRVSPVAPTSPCSAPDVGLGFPLVLHLRLYRRWIIESPRCSHLSAVPSGQYSSCPAYQPFGIADDSSSRLPRTSNPPAPIDGYPSYPGSRTYRFALVESPSYPGSSSLATAIDQFPGCPKSWVSHHSPIRRVSSCPESWSLG